MIRADMELGLMEQANASKSTCEVIKEKLRQTLDGKIVRKNMTKKNKDGAMGR